MIEEAGHRGQFTLSKARLEGEARARSIRRKGHRFYIEASEDAGLTYQLVHSGDDLGFLRDIGDQLNSEGMRWVIKGAQTGRIIDHCDIHQSIIDTIEKFQD